MPLSEREQQMLDEMEQALIAEDPRFASSMRGTTPTRRARLGRTHLLGLLGAVGGLVLVGVGVYAQLVWLGGIGFALLVAGAVLALAPVPQTLSALDDTGRPTVSRRTGRPGAGRRDRSRSEFMSMLEDRWERRRNGW